MRCDIFWWCLDITYEHYGVFHISERSIVHTTTQYTGRTQRDQRGEEGEWEAEGLIELFINGGWYPSPHGLSLRMSPSGSTQVSNMAYQVTYINWLTMVLEPSAITQFPIPPFDVWRCLGSPSNPSSFPKPQVEADAGEGAELQLPRHFWKRI